MQSNREWEIARLEERLDHLRATEDPTYSCANCGRSKDDVDYGLLTDVTVIIADGEEGYSNVTLLLCDDDLVRVALGLRNLGFIDHRHGSTSTLESPNCAGYDNMDDCPTPTHYGNVTWGKHPPQDPDDE